MPCYHRRHVYEHAAVQDQHTWCYICAWVRSRLRQTNLLPHTLMKKPTDMYVRCLLYINKWNIYRITLVLSTKDSDGYCHHYQVSSLTQACIFFFLFFFLPLFRRACTLQRLMLFTAVSDVTAGTTVPFKLYKRWKPEHDFTDVTCFIARDLRAPANPFTKLVFFGWLVCQVLSFRFACL